MYGVWSLQRLRSSRILTPPFLGYSTKDVWNTVQNEVRGLLYDYFTSVDRNVNFANAVLSVNELLKERKKSKDGNSKVRPSFATKFAGIMSAFVAQQEYPSTFVETVSDFRGSTIWQNSRLLRLIIRQR